MNTGLKYTINMKTKTAYTSKGVLFDSRDLAIISTNNRSPIEITVPESVELMTGKIDLSPPLLLRGQGLLFEVQLKDFDVSQIVDYTPEFRVIMNDNHITEDCEFDCIVPINGVEFGWSDISEELQEEIQEYCENRYGDAYELCEHYKTDLNED